MSKAQPSVAAELDVDQPERQVPPGDLRTHDGVESANARRCDTAPPPGWERDPNASVLRARGVDVDLSGMTVREREVFRSVDVHGIRPEDLARMTNAAPSTIWTLLKRARNAREER